MKKYIRKTTKEFTYDEKGYVLKEVETVEEYEEEVVTDKGIKSATISSDKIKIPPESPPFVDTDWHRTTGIPPYIATFGENGSSLTVNSKGDVTLNGDLKLPENVIHQIANEVKFILNKEAKREIRSLGTKLKSNKPC